MEATKTKREEAKDERRRRIVKAARDLIRETGSTDLSMRTLAERAGVSLATPYNLLGSKREILLAVLDDELEFNRRLETLASPNSLEHIFDVLNLANSFYIEDKAFYRALWQTILDASGPSDGGIATPDRMARSALLGQGLLQAAQRDGYINRDANIFILQGVLAINASGTLLSWVSNSLPTKFLMPTASLGFALTLNGAATAKGRRLLNAKIKELEAQLTKAGAQ